MRVRVLDSLVLDSELLRILQETIAPALNTFHLSQWTEEVQLLIKFILWKFSVYDRGFSVGQNLLGLTYSTTSTGRRRNAQLTLLFALESLVPYIYRKLERNVKTVNPAYWRWVDTVMKASQFLNLCIFIRNGHYPSLAHRMAQLAMIANPKMNQTPSADYSSSQTRQLVWHYFADFLTIVLPLIKLHRCRTYLARLVSPNESHPRSRADGATSTATETEPNPEDFFLTCCYCKDSVTIPITLNRCTFCYYCIKSNPVLETDILNGRNECQKHVNLN